MMERKENQENSDRISGDFMDLWMIWLGVVVLLTVIELSTVNLVSIWFIASAIASMIVSIFFDNFFVQFAIFVVGGIFLLLLTRKFLVDFLKVKSEGTNLDRVIGMEGVVKESVDKNVIGEVKVDGKLWSAISSRKIEVGESVLVERIDGVKLVVRKKDE